FRLWKHSGNRLNLIIQHYKFNTFIAMFLIITEIYLLLFRTHVKLTLQRYIKARKAFQSKRFFSLLLSNKNAVSAVTAKTACFSNLT
ncbi:hypothetical protein, partial [Bacteroides mediterraneensis]|uniref:hypothetical protein n=1 Tax=Bacteroides mediterraneensis TaxID=1841856 RepID=UPI00195E214F